MDRKHIKLSDIEIPQDIFTMEEKQRNELVLLVKTFLERILHREFGIRGNKKELLNKLIDSTIIVNEQEEKYVRNVILFNRENGGKEIKYKWNFN